MKKTILIVSFFLFLISCHKDNSGGNGIVIKGTIPAESASKRSVLAGESTLSLADATNVLVCFGETYKISAISNGTFSTNAPMNTATALIFLDENNHFIGNINVSGLNMLPLVNLANSDQTVIDLSTLTLESTGVIPANNPIGSEILISDQDVTLLKELDSYYKSLAKNIDTDNDGIPDSFSGKQLNINTVFNVNAGTFGFGSTAPTLLDTSQLAVNYSVRIKGWKTIIPDVLNISLTGPEGAPYSDIVKDNYEYNSDCGCFDVFFSRRVQNAVNGSFMLPFTQGIYTFTMDGTNNYTINYASINAKYFMLLAVPTMKTDNEGNITSVAVNYMLPDRTPIEPSKYITTMMLMFFDSNGNQIYHEGSIFNLNNVLPDFTNVTLSTPQALSAVHSITVSYTDLVGNIYNIGWQNQ